MEKISDTITSLFHITVENNCPSVCSSGDDAIVWSEIFGLGCRLGISYNRHEWFPKVRLYLDHIHSHTEQDQATVVVSLRDTTNKVADGFKERMATIREFGHGQPALLGSWSISDLALHPYVSLTLTTKARLPQPVTDPLFSASLAIRESMVNGDFVDTKFHVFSAQRPGNTAGKPRIVYANSNSVGLALPEPTSGEKQVNGSAPPFLLNMTGDRHINKDTVLHDYAYEQDSDLDDDEDGPGDTGTGVEHECSPSEFQTGSSSKPHIPTDSPQGNVPDSAEDDMPLTEPPAYSVSTCRMILVKGVAYKTWLSYIYFRYTGQMSFLPLKSAQGSPRRRPYDPSQPPSCSPKSMYRLAVNLGDERMKEIAFRAIREGLSKDNIVEEAFSWFTAQYPAITKYELEKVFELRKLPEVSSALKSQLKTVSLGEKPWAHDVLGTIMERLNV